MPRFTQAQIIGKALAAVEEAATEAVTGQVKRTKALAFALAFLANEAGERWPFDSLWREATRPIKHDGGAVSFGRSQSITNAMNGIYLQLRVARRWEGR